mgnify:CR=1 FL=1
MGFLSFLILSLLVVKGIGNNLPQIKDIEKKKIEVVSNKTLETKPTIQEVKPELVKEETKPELIKEEVKSELVQEETKPEPIKEETKPEPVKEEKKELDSLEDLETNYLRLALYIIAGILAVLTGMYFFSRKRNNVLPNTQSDTTEPQLTEEKVQSDITEPQLTEEEVQSDITEPQPTEPQPTEPQPTEPQPTEEEVQSDTTEPQPSPGEDEKNNK